MSERPPIVSLHVTGPLACFSRPEFSVERTSYPWITPSAARALFEAVLWKPRIRYEVREIQVLRPIRYISLRRNEIGTKVSTRGLGPEKWILTDEQRQQRNTMALVEVGYLIKAEIYLNPELKPTDADDNHDKYVSMFERRLAKGQHFHQPYLGCREFAADVRPPTGEERPMPISMQHGLMLYDFRFPTSPDKHRDWRPKQVPRPLYFDANLTDGVVLVPSWMEVLSRLPEALR
ncbi:MAG: type I-C CRISPR-associated protein Cas5c [Minicystis sp.]